MSAAGGITVELGWPDKRLSPNARAHFMQVSTARRAAKEEAFWAARAALGRRTFDTSAPIRIHVVAHPPLAWRTGDEDNLIAQMKSHFDAIAKALKVNDRAFQQTGVTWGERRERAIVIVQIGGEA